MRSPHHRRTTAKNATREQAAAAAAAAARAPGITVRGGVYHNYRTRSLR